MSSQNEQAPKRGRGRPRKNTESAVKSPLTAAERSALGAASWAKRKPTYQRGKCIALRPGVYEALNEQRGNRSWSEYLCDLAGIEAPLDARRVANSET